MELSASEVRWGRPSLLLVVLTLFALGPVCGHEFVLWDDTHNFVRDDAVAHMSLGALAKLWRQPHKDLYVPLTYTLWWAVAAMVRGIDGSLNPYVFHTLNLLLHVIIVLAAFALIRTVGFTKWPACFGAMVFAVHPVQVESVAWASGTKDLLAGLFTILALLAFLTWTKRSDTKNSFLLIAISTLAFVLAMLSKPSAVVTPALAAVLFFFQNGRLERSTNQRSGTSLHANLWPPILVLGFWFLLAMPFAWIAHHAQPVESSSKLGGFRALVALDALAFYARQVVAPIWLALDYGRSPRWLADSAQKFWTWLIPLAIAAGAIAMRKRRPFLLAGIAFFVLAVLPVLGLVPFDFQAFSTVADHYLYVAMLAIGLIVAGLLSLASRPPFYVAVGLWIAFLAVCSHLQAWTWHDSESLFQHTLAVNPTSVAAAINLGKLRADYADSLKAEGRFPEAIARSDEAISLYIRALATWPDDADARKNLGNMYKLQRRWLEAETQYRAVLRLRPDDADAHLQLGSVLGNQGRFAEAIEEFRQALRIEPDYAMARSLLEQALRMSSQTRPSAP